VWIGAHLSIAGGLHRALEQAGEYGFPVLALFVRNQRRWSAPPLTDEEVRRFRRIRQRMGIRRIVAHGSYLVNLAGGAVVRRKSMTATAEELDRCGRCGIEHLAIHPGSAARPKLGIRRLADALNRLVEACRHRRVKILLETTAGAGNTLGGRFEQLAEILDRLDRPRRFGVCLDTCHIFAAGYDIRTPIAYRQTMDRFDRVIGLARLAAVHVNDSRGQCGSHLDRHVHIGQGRIGRSGFANFLRDRRLAEVPMILETPKGTDPRGRDYDQINAKTLRTLARHREGRSGGRSG